MFALFSYKPRFKYLFGMLIILLITQQIITWVSYNDLILYKFDKCTFNMRRESFCEPGSNQAIIEVELTQYIGNPLVNCPGPNRGDCVIAFEITNLHNVVLSCSLVLWFYILVFYFFYFCFVCELVYCIKFHQLILILAYLIFSLISFINIGKLYQFSNGVEVNGQILIVLIIEGVLCLFIALILIPLNQDYNDYLKQDNGRKIIIEQTFFLNQHISLFIPNFKTQEVIKNNEEQLKELSIYEQPPQKIVQQQGQFYGTNQNYYFPIQQQSNGGYSQMIVTQNNQSALKVNEIQLQQN